MNPFILGAAILLSSAGLSPAAETSSRPTVLPAAFTFELRDSPSLSPNLSHGLNKWFRPVRRRASSQPAQVTAPKRCSAAARILAVAAGGFAGWMAGGAIGFVATSKPDDDVSGLRGVVIGAPIGAAVGAVIAYRLTR